MKKIYELAEGATFKWNGQTYVKGKQQTVRGGGEFFLCRRIDCDEIGSRPFSANLDVEVVSDDRV